jgi:hypothetical protein
MTAAARPLAGDASPQAQSIDPADVRQQEWQQMREDLAPYLDDETAIGERPGQVVENEADARRRADVLLAALGRVDQEEQQAISEYKGYVELLRLRQDRRLWQFSRRRDWLTNLLRQLLRFIPIRGRQKSVALLNGRIGTRAKAARWQLAVDSKAEQAALIAAVKARPELAACVVTVEAIDRDALREQLELLRAGEKIVVDDAGVVSFPSQDGEDRPLAGVLYVASSDEFTAQPAPRE